ncbi:MAG: hypothetical protein ACPK7O_07250 [Methanobacterium sp.]
MIEISETEIAVLGLLYEHHHYANRIEEIIEKRKMPSWANVEFSHDILETLEEKSLIATETIIIDSQNSKKVYSITNEGKIIFREKNKAPYNFIVIFNRSNALLKAEREWIKEFIEKIKEENKGQ